MTKLSQYKGYHHSYDLSWYNITFAWETHPLKEHYLTLCYVCCITLRHLFWTTNIPYVCFLVLGILFLTSSEHLRWCLNICRFQWKTPLHSLNPILVTVYMYSRPVVTKQACITCFLLLCKNGIVLSTYVYGRIS